MVLISCDPEFEAQALQELRELWPAMPSPEWVGDGVARCVPGVEFGAFAALVTKHAPIFIRHIAPVQREVELSGGTADLELFANAALSLASLLNPNETFAVQTRFLHEEARPYRKFTLNETLSTRLQAETGAAMECKTPAQVVSVACTQTRGYVGISRTAQNRSAWPGGEHRFKREEGQISRAEFKLLEALDVFGLTLPVGGKALDMGAAPGGWTRVLRQQGLRVVAVDPADMDVRFRRDPNVTHVAKTIEAFLPTLKTRFDVVVNDMRMDADASVEMMLKASRSLVPDGLAIMTLKLTKAVETRRSVLDEVRQALERLRREYDVVGARQLYHNRSEVTAALRRKSEG